MNKPLIVDIHLDLSMNAMEWNRDLRRSVADIRVMESGMTDKPDRGNGTVAFPDMRSGNIGLCVATLIARYVKPSNPLPGWNSPEQAWAHIQSQLAWYREMERQGFLRQIRSGNDLDEHLAEWAGSPADCPIGYVLSLEGADSIVSMEHLELLVAAGLRALGPAHYGPGTYAFGTDSEGPMGDRGQELLTHMERLGVILDVTHLCDTSFREAMDHFGGRVWASHSNCRALVNHNRQFADRQIREIIARDGIIGLPLDAWMMVPGWQRGKSVPADAGVTLDIMIDHLLHICEIAGNAAHVCIGTDLDGGFGREQCPADIGTIADLQRLPELLGNRGFSQAEIAGILHDNATGFLRKALG